MCQLSLCQNSNPERIDGASIVLPSPNTAFPSVALKRRLCHPYAFHDEFLHPYSAWSTSLLFLPTLQLRNANGPVRFKTSRHRCHCDISVVVAISINSILILPSSQICFSTKCTFRVSFETSSRGLDSFSNERRKLRFRVSPIRSI